jgi:hypothetical protein
MTEETQSAEDHLFVFVDTNVFLHFTFFRDVDWCAELNAPTVTLVLAPVVLDELDDKKRDGTRRDRERAKTVLRALADLSLVAGPATLRLGVTVEALDEEPDDAFFAQHRLRPRNGDDRLLATALSFQARHPDARVVILSDDTGLGIRGPRRNVSVVAPDDHLRLPDEPDDAQRELEVMRRENAALKNAAPKLRVGFQDGAHLELTTALAAPWEPAQRHALLDQWRKKHPRVSGTADRIALPGGQTIDLSGFHYMLGGRSAADAATRKKEIEGAFKRYETYLESWPAKVNAVRRCIEIRVVLENDGSAFAHDVHLTLRTDAPGIWREGLPKIKRPPEPPRERGPYDFLAPPHIPNIDFPTLADRDAPIDGPNIREDDASDVEYTVRRVKHHVPCELPVVYFQFAGDADIASFTINYKLVAANIPKPQEGRLNVRITLEAPGEPPTPETVFAQADEDDD